jgi:hypothetical protein
MPAVTRAENPEEELSTEESRISLLVKVPAEDGTAVVEMTGPAVPENGLQAFGDWVLAALERFKDVLGSWPGELDRWYAFSAERQRGRARAWLADAGYYVRKGLPPS